MDRIVLLLFIGGWVVFWLGLGTQLASGKAWPF